MSIAYDANHAQTVVQNVVPESITAELFNELLAERNEYKRLLDEEYARRCEAEEQNELLRSENESCQRILTVHQLREERRRNVLRNTDLIPLEKLLLIEYMERTEQIRVNVHEPTVHHMERIAADLGITSTSTIRRRNQAMEKCGILNYTPGTAQRKEDGSFYTPVTIELTPLIDNPSLIQKAPEDKHGGPREKRCAHCGSDDIDSYTVEHCRNCGKNAWKGQTGLRGDANVMDAIKSQKHHAFGVSNQLTEDTLQNDVSLVREVVGHELAPETSQKHHAFGETSAPIQLKNHHALPTSPVNTSNLAQKHDAFGEISVDLVEPISEEKSTLPDQNINILPPIKSTGILKGSKMQKTCARCGEIPNFILTPLGHKICSCSQYSLDELKVRKLPRQTELL